MKAFVKLWYEEFGSAEVPVAATERDASSTRACSMLELSRAHSLLELYRHHSYELDLGFNDKREETWPSLLGRCINKHKNQVFEIAKADGSTVRVKLRRDRNDRGAVKWLERLKD